MERASIAKLGAAAAGLAGIAALAWLSLRDEPRPRSGPDLEIAPPDGQETGDPTELAPAERPVVRSVSGLDSAAASLRAYRGIVRAPDGASIEGAELTLFATPGNWREQEPLGASTSGADGRFTISVPADDDTARSMLIVAQAEGFAGLSMNPVVPEREIEIRLSWSTELFGTVLDADTGAPIPGATVARGGDSVTSDASGSYRLTGVVVGQRSTVTADKEGYAREETSVLLGEPVPAEHVIRMNRGVALRLEVFDAHTGKPLPDARVVRDHDDVLGTTDTRGGLEIGIVEGSELSLEVSAQEYARFRWIWKLVDASALSGPRIPMKGLARIEGVVIDEQGKPVVNARFYGSYDGHPSRVPMPPQSQATYDLPGYAQWELPEDLAGASDVQGRFSVPVIPVDTPYFLKGGHRDFVAVKLGPVVLAEPGQRAWLDVELRKGARIRGHVRYNDQPLAGADVVYEDERGDFGGCASIGEEGSYELANVPAGRVTLKLRDSLSRASKPPEAKLVVEAVKEYEQDLVWTEALATITGRVIDPRGAPVADEGVTAIRRDDRSRRFQARTLRDGTFTVEVALGGTYDVGVNRGPARDTRTDVRAGAEGVELMLPDVGRLRLRLVDAATDEPIRPPKTSLWGLGWRQSGSQSFKTIREEVNHDGGVELELPVGVVDLAFHLIGDGYAPRHVHGIPVSVEGTGEPLVVALERGVAVKLVLSGDASIERFRGHLLFLLHESQLDSLRGPFAEQGGPSNHRINGINMWVAEPGLLDQMLELEPTGVTSLRGLSPGRYTLKSFPDDFVFEPSSFDLLESDRTSDERATVEVRWRSR